MARTIFIYGLVAGVLTLTLVGVGAGILGFDHGVEGMVWGYVSMVVGLSVMFVGVRRYAEAHGPLTFVQAFLPAFGIFVFAGLIYVVGWEAYLAATHYTFAEEFASQTVAAKVAEGATAAELVKLEADMAHFKLQYANPLFRLPMTFLEIAPIGLILSLLAGFAMRTPRGDDHAFDDED
ncbi:hypothetical protein SPAN111604_01955 [Sphingomonas antarctica]|uniref:DUF4199 domain-containing protein n=1 Tax=Sphingomonas antarctica TaxID=2040274 RepID=UPI0039EAD7A3